MKKNLQLDKKKLKQLESQNYSNSTMARLISTAEIYALSMGFFNPQMYKKFDQFDNLKRKNKDELEGELILQIECFKISMESYKKKHKKYDFPEDFDKKATISELENIKKQVCNRDKKYYSAIINLINGKTNIPSFDEELTSLENSDEKKSDKVEPELQLKIGIPIIKYVDNAKHQVKNNYIQNPDYKIRLNLNEPLPKNPYLENLLDIQKELDYKKRMKNVEEFKENKKNNDSLDDLR